MRANLFLKSTAMVLLASGVASGQVIISDDYDVTGSGTGFALGSGVNSGINPPVTRLSGLAADGLRYIATDATKTAGNYSINSDALAVRAAANSGRLSLSTDGATAYDFSTLLTTPGASSATPAVYDVTISMANNAAGTQRFSFALGTQENNANFWDFGIQLYRANLADDFYTIQHRIDVNSYGSGTSAGSTGDINASIATTAPGTYGTLENILLRVTDAGAETTSYDSRVQVSLDGGNTWIYDTQTDPLLPSGWRLDGAGRYFMWDIAAQAVATYDNFSVTLVTPAPEPSFLGFAFVGGLAALLRRRRMSARQA